MHEVAAFAQRVAALRGWRLNADASHLQGVLAGLAGNLRRYGYYLCPCRDGSGDRSRDSDIICPCLYAGPDVAERGHCYCGLYLSPDFAACGRAVEPIPERRSEAAARPPEEFA